MTSALEFQASDDGGNAISRTKCATSSLARRMHAQGQRPTLFKVIANIENEPAG